MNTTNRTFVVIAGFVLLSMSLMVVVVACALEPDEQAAEVVIGDGELSPVVTEHAFVAMEQRIKRLEAEIRRYEADLLKLGYRMDKADAFDWKLEKLK